VALLFVVLFNSIPYILHAFRRTDDAIAVSNQNVYSAIY